MPFERRLLRDFDWPLLGCVLLLSLFGIVAIASAARGWAHPFEPAKRQALWLVLGLFLMGLVLLPDHTFFVRLRKPAYVLAILLLLLTFVVGKRAGGAARWLPLGPIQIQPSEVVKLAVILWLAHYMATHEGGIKTFGGLIKSALPVLPATGLVMLQPDLSTSLVLVAIWLGMAFVAGARPSHLALVVLVGLLLFGAAWKFDILREYQKQRILAFINPEADPRGTGYHILQAQIAIGSGRLFGKGLFNGTQSQLRFVPAQHTDFIFTVVGEETGFLGSVLLLGLYALLFWRLFLIMLTAQDRVGLLLCAGVASLLVFQTFVNIGVCTGILPPTGLPLPFMSYGGTAMLAYMFGIGMVLNVGIRRRKIVF